MSDSESLCCRSLQRYGLERRSGLTRRRAKSTDKHSRHDDEWFDLGRLMPIKRLIGGLCVSRARRRRAYIGMIAS